MNKISLTIWGRSFELPVAFDCYEGEEVLQVQYDALNELCDAQITIEEAKSNVEKYCVELNAKEIGAQRIDNIFKYVMPTGVYVRRSNSADRFVGLICKYRFNLEDGLVVLFKNGAFYEIGTSDIL